VAAAAADLGAAVDTKQQLRRLVRNEYRLLTLFPTVEWTRTSSTMQLWQLCHSTRVKLRVEML
jgi:hypothetical protein